MLFLSILLYSLAAFLEIAGCFTFWLYFRLEKSPLWLIPGMISLILFAFTLTRIDVDLAGRAYAIYGGIYIIGSLLWLWLIEKHPPDQWDLLGAIFCLCGAMIILLAPRG